MATVSDVVRRALRIINSLDAAEAVDASDMQDAIGTLNAMLAEWHESGIGFPDYSVTEPTEELASDEADRDAVAYQLALRLAPEYGVEPSPFAHQQAQTAFFRLRSRYLQVTHPVVGSYF